MKNVKWLVVMVCSFVLASCEMDDVNVSDFLNDLDINNASDGDTDMDADGDGDGDVDMDADTDTDSDTDYEYYVMLSMEDNGWIDGSINDIGIRGPWYTFGDQTASYVPGPGEPIVVEDRMICFNGSDNQVINDEWDTTWGAGIGFDLCAMEDGTRYPLGSCPLDPSLARRIRGVAFDMWGTVNADELRISYYEGTDVVSAYTSTAGGDVFWTESRMYDASVGWDPSQKPEGVIPENVESINIQIPTNTQYAIDWDFCISNVYLILGPEIIV